MQFIAGMPPLRVGGAAVEGALECVLARGVCTALIYDGLVVCDVESRASHLVCDIGSHVGCPRGLSWCVWRWLQ